jgi:hypothetical protein
MILQGTQLDLQGRSWGSNNQPGKRWALKYFRGNKKL